MLQEGTTDTVLFVESEVHQRGFFSSEKKCLPD